MDAKVVTDMSEFHEARRTRVRENNKLISSGQRGQLKKLENIKAKENMVAKNSKPLFIHVPKTSGRHLSSVLKNKIQYYTHKPAFALKKPMPDEKWKSLDVFTIVRHPLDRFCSAYCFNRRHIPTDINEFVDYLIDCPMDITIQGGHREHFNSQAHFVADQHREIIVPTIYRFENLEDVYAELSEKFDVNLKYKPSETKYQDMLSTPSIDYLIELYQIDFSLFGYDYP